MDMISPGLRFAKHCHLRIVVAIAGKAALPLESCIRIAAELSWCRGWWVTQSLGGEGLGELAVVGGAEAADSACHPIPSPAWVFFSL